MFQTIKSALSSAISSASKSVDAVTIQAAHEAESKFQILKNEAEETQPLGSPLNVLRAKQYAVATAVAHQTELHAERIRVTNQIKIDLDNLASNRKDAQAAITKAGASIDAAQRQHTATGDRLRPLRARVDDEIALAQINLQTAQKAFDTAMTSGNESDEVAAAEALSLAQKQASPGALKGSPLSLRVAALENELAQCDQRVEASKIALTEAAAQLAAIDTNICQVHYDRKVSELVDLVVEHNQKCPINSLDTFGSEILIFEKNRFIPGYSLSRGRLLNLQMTVANLVSLSKPIDAAVLLETLPYEATEVAGTNGGAVTQ